ncbi:MAG: N-acetylmuramoyl-L-alanine amidase [Armatimonadetes bacterium]|nr:N-acetylmuramoyl-L-alanine amidase [Armatimonadota bacterium]
MTPHTPTDTPAKARPEAPPAGPLEGKTICISPGHPSDTGEGATGPAGTTETHINWVISLKLKEALQKQGAKVVMGKGAENEKVTNRRSAEIANESNADLFLRIHCDSGTGSGFGIFYPDQQGRRGDVAGPSRTVIAESHVAAKAIESGMRGVLAGKLRSRGVLGDSITYVGEQQGALTGSIFSEVPVVCVEMCMLTNRADEKFITSDSGQEVMVTAIVAGVKTYLCGG